MSSETSALGRTAESERVKTLLAAMTLDEKAALTAGAGPWHTTAVERVGIGACKLTDGSNGARGESFHGTSSVCFPCGVALGATWDVSLVERVGVALAEECHLKDAHVLLAPTINLHRYLLGGRNFESMGEDPWHVSRLAVAYVRGLQSCRVAAVPKHFVANDSEIERESIDVIVDEKTLREVYLRPFEAAVTEGGAWALMSSYNKVNGTHASEHPWLLTEVLKAEWGFDGVVVSDWGGTNSTEGTALAGLDLEMPGPPTHLGPFLADAVRAGTVSEAVVDEKARRILQLLIRTGALDGQSSPERSPGPEAHSELVREAAASAIVLLKNNAGALPLDADVVGSVAVIGPNAQRTQIQGGGSSKVNAPYETNVLDSLRSSLGDGVRVEFSEGCSIARYAPVITASRMHTPDGEPGALVEYLQRRGEDLHLVRSEEVQTIDLAWIGAPLAEVPMAETVVRCRFRYVPEETGDHVFGLVSAGHAVVELDGTQILDSNDAEGHGPHFFGRGSSEVRATLQLESHTTYDVVLTLETRTEKSATAGMTLGVFTPSVMNPIDAAAELAAGTDAAVVVVGTSSEWEMEGGDRPDLDLPGDQVELVRTVAARNPHTVVVVNAGSAVALPFADEVAAIVYVWFGGQEIGNAVTEVLLGQRDPGGRLPVSLPAASEDVLDIRYRGLGGGVGGPGWGGEGGTMTYAEGSAIGYRHHQLTGRRAQYSFGHGLSYTQFDYQHFDVEVNGDGTSVARCTVQNTGDRSGYAVPQVYATAPGDGTRTKRLVSFTKVHLQPGETAAVTMPLDPRAFRQWCTSTDGWALVEGNYTVELAVSADDPIATITVTIQR